LEKIFKWGMGFAPAFPSTKAVKRIQNKSETHLLWTKLQPVKILT